MAVPTHKLPQLLKTPLHLPNLSKIVFRYPYNLWAENNIRYFYKTKAPLIKYYNPHLKLELDFKPEVTPTMQLYSNEEVVEEISNDTKPEEILQKLTQIQETNK